MQAASNLTTLDITYEGQRRLVEYHSLVFKRRKDGFGQEYFYASIKLVVAPLGQASRRFFIQKFSH
jgi:hypothetical protein